MWKLLFSRIDYGGLISTYILVSSIQLIMEVGGQTLFILNPFLCDIPKNLTNNNNILF